ncbi:hypothetical protein NGB36_01525 [Streptomyces sp. RB6PN25]|uniref:Uncharacterized protein n=1 Tax=Streptomyces humicola TaxID=2953240 RepID=A0ABT1PNS7_9ACTN|nr:hypothetical protein [Streptomyces humicola]MCQ4079318.1 hypothetical protein [Streptomyces humicola]
MVDVRGNYTFQTGGARRLDGTTGTMPLSIFRVLSDGTMDARLADHPVEGRYSAATQSIQLAHGVGASRVFGTFYDGFAILDDQGGVCGLAGMFEERDALRDCRGSWYAVRTGPVAI